MKQRSLCMSVAGCLCLARATMGQPDHVLMKQGSNSAPTTQEQRVAIDQHDQLNHAAAVALHTGDYVTAEADARQALSLGQDSGEGQELLASALDAQGRTVEALRAYQDLATAGSSFPRVLLPYALLLLKSGQWPQAVVAYEKALPLLPNVTREGLPKLDIAFSPALSQPAALAAAIHVALGLNDNWEEDWGQNSQNDRALREYQQALAMEPNWDAANYYYGYGLQRLGRAAEARAAFTKTVKIAKGDVKVAAQKALAQSKKPV